MQIEKINPKMFTIGREARGYSQAELAEIVGLSRPSITRFEVDRQQLSQENVEAMLGALKFPESLLYINEEELPPATYRKSEDVPAKVLTKIDAIINVYAYGIGRLLKAVQFDKLNVPLIPVSESGSPAKSAELTRAEWKLSNSAIENMIDILEANGFITIPVDFGTEYVDSRSILIDGKYPVIFYNQKLLGDRLRFSLAYELGHIVMHTRQQVVRIDDSHEAKGFAAAFLMPEQAMLKDLDNDLDVEKLGALKIKYRVSMQSILYRAEDLHVITENQKRYLVNRFNKLKILKREPKELDVPIERGQLLRDLITKYRTKQKMNLKQIAEFFYLLEEEFLFRYNQTSNN